MSDTPDPSKLQEFEARLAAAKKSQEPDLTKRHVHHDTGAAWRMVIELVTGIVVGFGIGYGLDTLFGTLPIFLVLFTLLGFGAGVRVMMQTAAQTQKDAAKAQKTKDEA